MARRNSGSIDVAKFEVGGNKAACSVLKIELPKNKEELEAFFGNRFIEEFNRAKPLGDDVVIENAIQNTDTSELDYDITCSRADTLELAELTPLSAEFGRDAMKSGIIDIYEFGKWINNNILLAKAKKYGELSRRTVLLLYSTHFQFNATNDLTMIIRSTLRHRGNPFNSVFYLRVIDDNNCEIVALCPFDGDVPTPRHFKGKTQTNVNLDQGEVVREGSKVGLKFTVPIKR